ncbi:MAG: GH25 family lysozyme, partial [Pygmaiobacter sp.]
LHASAYSFNGGWTWQTGNTFTVSESKTWVPGTICVRDAAGNINYNRADVTAGSVADKVPPVLNITVKGSTVTVSATDDVALHASAYSFNGGWTWQTGNTYTISGTSQTWVPGTICVRDAAGNINYNRADVNVGDTTAPVINSITVTPQGDAPKKTVTISATDDTALAEQAYSFNGGWTWQASNTYTVKGSSQTWVPGTICVRDVVGNINYNRIQVEALISKDVTAPQVKEIRISEGLRYMQSKVVTVSAVDDGDLNASAYSFNGGWTWQTENTIALTEPKSWPAGTICVRDSEGNIGYNTTTVTVGRFIKVTKKAGTATVEVVEGYDNGWGYPPSSYSFNGGTTWQSSNVFTIKATQSWVPGTILAKDGVGNVNYNGETIEVKLGAECIDVSSYQGQINWQQVRASGVTTAIMRAITWSGDKTNGTWIIDPFFEYNVKAAKAQGIKVGAYIYTYAFGTSEAAAEVNLFHSSAQRLKSQGYTLDLPVFVDHEYNPILSAVPNKGDRTALLKYEMDLLDQYGYYPGMYMSTNWALNNVDAKSLQAQGYDLWIADGRGYNGWGNSVVGWQY